MCEICSKSFGNNSDMKRHQRTVHENEKPFECEICLKSFGGKITLKTHERTAHKNNKPFVIPKVC